MRYIHLTPARLAHLRMTPSITALLLTPAIGQEVARRLLAASLPAAMPTTTAAAQGQAECDDDLFNDLPI